MPRNMHAESGLLHPVLIALIPSFVLDGAIEIPEYKLMVRVLDRALKDLRHEKPSIARQSKRWFMDPRLDPFSFRFLCDYLGLSPEKVLMALEIGYQLRMERKAA